MKRRKSLLFLFPGSMSFPAYSTTGIGSAIYLWVLAPVVLGLIALAVMTFKFLARIRRDSLSQDDKRIVEDSAESKDASDWQER